MKFDFANIQIDRAVRDQVDAIVGIAGDFSISVGGEEIYREQEFCLAEFAFALASWIVGASGRGPDFVYTSIESEVDGLVRFTLLPSGRWRVSSPHQDREARDVEDGELDDAVLDYLRSLRTQLADRLDLFDFIESGYVRSALELRLARWRGPSTG